MGRNDFFDIEDKIRNAVDTAFHYVDDYENIKHSALNEVRNHLKRSTDFAQDTFDSFNKRYRGNTQERNRNNNYSMSRQPKQAVSVYVSPKPAGRISSIILNILGALGGIGSAILVFCCAIVLFTSNDDWLIHGSKVMALGFSLVFVFSLSLSFIGSNIRKRLKRFKKYADYIGDKKYCKIESLALAIGENNKFVLKDLQKMIKLDMFREGHIDDESSYLILGNVVYEDYLKSKEAFNKRKDDENKKKQDEENDTSELGALVRMGREYIRQIRSANDAIPGEIISAKLDKLEKIVTAIFTNIEKNEKKVPDVKKFINHYMPMTLKLVNSYKELDSQVVQGENIKNAKMEIEKSLDLINTAFEKLLDDLFADVVMDVSSDISVLETLFSQEGLTEDELKKKK